MNHLIIHATHRNESFISQAVVVLGKALLAKGENVLLRDLYSINFDPILTVTDFEMTRHGNTPEDIRAEQEYISSADIIWFFYPVWWTGMPAILKGYIDRVFLSGFAYKMAGNNPIGLLRDKKVVIINSMGQTREEYEELGMFEAMKLTTDTGVFGFCGMHVICHKYFTSIMSVNEKQRLKYFKEIEKLVEHIVENKPECVSS